MVIGHGLGMELVMDLGAGVGLGMGGRALIGEVIALGVDLLTKEMGLCLLKAMDVGTQIITE